MSLWGGDFCETIDYKNYSRGEDLIGYHEASRDLQAWLEAPSGRSLIMSRHLSQDGVGSSA
jgi:hypothetical protein